LGGSFDLSALSGVSSSFLYRFNVSFLSHTGRHLLTLISKDLFHAEADTWAIAAAFAGRLPFRRFRQIVAVLLFENAARFPILPKVTAPAAARTVSIVTHAVDHDSFFFHRLILLFHDGSAEPAEMKKARLPFRTVTGLCMEVFFWKRKDARQEELSAEHLRIG
jgi:hypothetical protein